jgi:hypothetical protein
MNDLMAGWSKFNEDFNVDKSPDFKAEEKPSLSGNSIFRVNSFTVDMKAFQFLRMIIS